MSNPVRRQHRYTDEEKRALVSEITRRHQAGAGSLKAISNELGISDASYHKWRNRFMEPKQDRQTVKPGTFSAADRERLIAKIEQLRAGGRSVEKACEIAGISDKSYYTWKKKAAPAMRPVELTDRSKQGVTALVPSASTALTVIAPPERIGVGHGLIAPRAISSSLSLLAPGGYRLEGLEVETAVALLRALA